MYQIVEQEAKNGQIYLYLSIIVRNIVLKPAHDTAIDWKTF